MEWVWIAFEPLTDCVVSFEHTDTHTHTSARELWTLNTIAYAYMSVLYCVISLNRKFHSSGVALLFRVLFCTDHNNNDWIEATKTRERVPVVTNDYDDYYCYNPEGCLFWLFDAVEYFIWMHSPIFEYFHLEKWAFYAGFQFEFR